MLVLICAVFLLPAQAEFLLPESILHGYIVADGEIKVYIQNMDSQIRSVYTTAREFVVYMEQNITELRTSYGEPRFKYYASKYIRTAEEFEIRKGLSEECLSLVAGVLMDNFQMQDQLSESIIECLTYWKTGYKILNKMIIETRITLVNLEEKAYKCADHFDVSDDKSLWDCAEEALEKSWKLSFETSHEIKNELTSLAKRTEEALQNLHKSLERKGVFAFYNNEDLIDNWLKTYCSIQSQNITAATQREG